MPPAVGHPQNPSVQMGWGDSERPITKSSDPAGGGVGMTGFVAHLDSDCYYVSAARVRHADLVGKPVGVLGNNGACVIAKSYEMKARGVKAGTPIWDAKALCPEGVYVKRDFYWYEVLSRKMLGVVGTFSPTVE